VLAHRYPQIPNLGDVNKIHEKAEFKTHEIDILVGGTPCQSFSKTGRREGFNDPRGRLALQFLEIAEMRRPRWLVWENVVEVLSSNGGRDFGAFLRKMGKIGYGYSWHVLDAYHFGVPQSRRRLFVVGYLGDWKRAAAIFSGREVVRTNHRPNGGAGDADARRDGARAPGAGPEAIAVQGNLIGRRDEAGPNGPGWRVGPMYTLTATDRMAVIAIQSNTINRRPDTEHLSAGWRDGKMYCLTGMGRHATIANGVARYILPVEAERLQGLPHDYTKVPYRGMPAEECPDDPRHEAVGNAMCVPVVRWVGERIAFLDSLPKGRVTSLLSTEDLARTLTDSELIERCVQGFRKLKEIIPYLREARQRFGQPGRRVPVAGNPTWTEWVEQNLGVTVRRVQQLLREAMEPGEVTSRGSQKPPRKLAKGDWRSLLKVSENRLAQVFGPLEDEKELAGAIRRFAQGIADRFGERHCSLLVSVSIKKTRSS
jgi:DNA (cytosine-5)-methyltransferase 1